MDKQRTKYRMMSNQVGLYQMFVDQLLIAIFVLVFMP